VGMTFKPRETLKARALRANATPSERKLWRHLSASQLNGYKFSRQIPIGPFICDFVCRMTKLVVEIDGHSHDNATEYDTKRTEYLHGQGYHVIRFTNEEVSADLEGVLINISQTLAALPTLSPSRKREGDVSP
jgi:very-short-patch-repair endonuclease